MNVLLFATAASMCIEKDSNGACMEGGAFQLAVNLVGACIGASKTQNQYCVRNIHDDYSHCIIK